MFLLPGECGVIIEAYRLGISLVLDSNANREVGALIKQFETLKQVLKEVQTGVNEVASGMRGLSRIGNSAAESWRSAARAMQDAARAARAAGNAMPNGRRAAAAAAAGGGGEASERPVSPGPRVPAALLTYEGSRALVPDRGEGRDLIPYTSRETGFSTRGDPYGPGTSLVPAGPRSEFGERTYARSPTWGALAPFVDRGPGTGFRMNGDSYIPDNGSRAVGGYQGGGGGRGPIDLNLDGWEFPEEGEGPGRGGAGARHRRRHRPTLHQTAVESGLAAYEGWGILKDIAEPTVEADSVMARMRAAQFTDDQVKQSRDLAYQMVWNVPGMTYAGGLDLINQTTSFTGDFDEAKALTPTLARDAQVLSLYGKGDAIRQIEMAVKAGELTGLTDKNGKMNLPKLQEFVDRLTETTVAGGGTLDMGKYLTSIRMFGIGADSSSMDFLTNILPAYQKIMGEAKAGTALSSFRQSLMSAQPNTQSKKYFEEQRRIGMRDSHNNLINPDMLSHDTNDYITNFLLPLLYKDKKTTPAQIEAELYRILPRQTMDRLAAAGIFDQGVINKEAERNRKQQAAGTAPLDDLLKDSPANALKAFNAALSAFETMLGEAVLKPAAAALNDLTQVLHKLADWAKENPDGAKTALEGAALGLAAFAATSLAASALIVMTNPVTGFIALAGGIEALGHAFTNFPKWVIDMAAGAGAGAMVGGLPGAVIGAAGGVVVGQVARDPKGTLNLLEGVTSGADSPFGLSPSGSVTVGGTHINPWATDNTGSSVRPFGASSSRSGASGAANDPVHVKVVNPGDVANGVTKNTAKSLARPQTGVTGFDPSMGAALTAIPGGF